MHAITHHIGPGGIVAKPFALAAQQRADQGGHPEGGDLNHPDECASKGVAKTDRPGIVADRAKTRGELANRTAAGQGLQSGWEDDGDQHQEHRRGDAEDGLVSARSHPRGHGQADPQGATSNPQVHEARECAQRQAGGGQLQGYGLAGDEVVNTDADCAAAHPVLLMT